MADGVPRRSRRFGNYEIISLIGRGGMASVYKARELSGRREGWPVAIKRLLPDLTRDPEYVELFEREAALCKLLSHPNIVTLYEANRIENIFFMAMELVDGRDLAHIIQQCKRRRIQLPVDFAVYLAKVLLDALACAHVARGADGRALHIVHCDVSPSNLFISRTGEIKLGDFGVACARVGSERASAVVAGKPFYVSPEVLSGAITPEGDLWAAAVVLYELLTLERPYTGESAQEVFKSIRKLRPKSVRAVRSDVTPGLAEVVDQAFARDRRERFLSAAEFGKALAPHYDENVGTPLAIAAVVRGLFGTEDAKVAAP